MIQQINLYQPIFRQPRRVFTALAMLQTVLAVVCGLIAVYAYAEWQVSSLGQQVKQLALARSAAERRFAELQERLPRRVAEPALAERVATLTAELAETRRLAAALNQGAFGNTTGLSPFLAALARQHVAGTWLTHIEITEGGTQIGMAGRALTPELVPTYVQRLATEQAFDGKAFSRLTLDRKADSAAVTFKLATVGIPDEERVSER